MIYGLFWVMSATAVGGAVALYLLSALYLFSAVLALDVVGAMIVRRNGDMKRFSKHRGDAAS